LTYFTEAILARRLGASRAIVPSTSSDERRRWRPKAPGLRWCANRPTGFALHRSPDGPASRFTPRLPERTDFVPMKWVNI
jgi:hypothetical protein